MTVRHEEVLRWTQRLVNLDEDRCLRALTEIASWRCPLVTAEFVERPDIDGVSGAVLLVEAIEALTEQGVPHSKLLKKLGDARQVNELWAVWAEIRAAAILLGHPEIEMRVEMEVNAGSTRRPDYRFVMENGASLWLEFKAVGLSEDELDWHSRAAERFNWLLPPDGLSTLHGQIDQQIAVKAAKRNRAWRESQRVASVLRSDGFAWGEVRGISVVGHQTEATYVRRAQSAMRKAIKQLPRDEESWIGLWWGNGAPHTAAAEALDEISAPDNIAGVLLLGHAVAVPWPEINSFILPVPRGARREDGYSVASTVDDTLATRILERYESSSGVRPTLVHAPTRTPLFNRDGTRRLFPFNLLFDSDPRRFADQFRPPSPVQDTKVVD